MLRLQTEDGIQIAYYEWNPGGAGPPVVLQHGLAGTAHMNWVGPGFVDALVAAGRRVIAIDGRGHGASDRPHDPALHGHVPMARDVTRVVDRLAVDAYDLVGYSLGAIVAMTVAAQDRRVRRLVLGGVGGAFVERARQSGAEPFSAELAEALATDDRSSIADALSAGVRAFVDSVGADRLALAALCRSARAPIALERITAETLLVVGDTDPLAMQPALLAAAIPGARLELLTGDHFGVLGDPRYARTLVAFLS